MGDKWKTSVNSCGPRHAECETSVKDKCGRRVWETSVSCKLMRPKAPRVADRCNSCGPRHPEWDASPETEAKSCGPGMQPFERSKTTPYSLGKNHSGTKLVDRGRTTGCGWALLDQFHSAPTARSLESKSHRKTCDPKFKEFLNSNVKTT